MTYEFIRYEQVGGVAVVTYDHQARRNAWGLPMYREVVAAIETANAEEAVGAIVLTHAGPAFCSGADLKAEPEPPDPVTGRRSNIAMTSMAQDTSWLHLLARSKPTIGAVRGAAIGLGVTQLLALDIRIGGEGSTYAFPFLARATMPELGCTALLPRLVGYGRAVHICLTAASLDARQALEIGLVSQVFPDEQLLPEAMKLAQRIAQMAPLQVKLTRDLLRDNSGEHDPNVFLQRERDAFVALFRAQKRGDPEALARGEI